MAKGASWLTRLLAVGGAARVTRFCCDAVVTASWERSDVLPPEHLPDVESGAGVEVLLREVRSLAQKFREGMRARGGQLRTEAEQAKA